jgi:predicted phosphoribosyltransferase
VFRDRKDAGQKLAVALKKYENDNPLILAIPRGGIEVAYYVAEHLNAQMVPVVIRKLPLPYSPEAGFGAIAEDGSKIILDYAATSVTPEVIEIIIKQQKLEIERRIQILRGGKPLPEIEQRIVIVIDDGIAMGSTMRAAIKLCRNKNAKKIIAASPVAGPVAAADMKKIADEAVILEIPPNFAAVSQVYQKWYDVPFDEALKFLNN